MGFFSFMETSFFFTLGITFLLILLLVYHFKQRLITTESKQDTMFEIINNLVQEINNIKTSIALMNRPPTPYPENLQNVFRTEPHVVIRNINNEPDEESHEDSDSDSESEMDIDSDDEDESDVKIIVSDNEDNISVEELSDTEDLYNQDATNNEMLKKEDKQIAVEQVEIEQIEVEQVEVEQVEDNEKPDFNKMYLGNLKSYILKHGWVEDASKMKKAQILTLIQEHST